MPSGGDETIVAVLDTGIDQDHPDLTENIIDCVAFGYRTCKDDNGHGTHVAGTIAANGGPEAKGIYGIAPDADLMAIKVLDRKGRGYADDIAAGIYYAVNNGANIISMSLGGRKDVLISSAVTHANNSGVLVIASAGNNGPAEGSISYPAANPNVMAIGAIYYKSYIETFDWTSCIDITPGDEAVACWSSRGINDGIYSIGEKEVELAAPGVFVESTSKNGCYESMSGTSMAAPHIAGLAAKLWNIDAATTRIALQNLAKMHDLYLKGYDTATGFGLPIVP